jgi:hypothetical protein
MKSEWFGTAISSPAFMHSLLCTAALHRFVVGRGSIDAILYHRTQAISAINAAISNPDVNVGISDANIGAVFSLLTVEEYLASPLFEQEPIDQDHRHQFDVHMNGLRRMVQLRGGILALHSNRVLQAFMLWCVIRTPHPTARNGSAFAY